MKLKELKKKRNQSSRGAVNPFNDKLMVREGLRPPRLFKRQFTKTEKVRNHMSKLIGQHKRNILKRGLDPKKVLNLPSKSHTELLAQLVTARTDHFNPESEQFNHYPLFNNISNFKEEDEES